MDDRIKLSKGTLLRSNDDLVSGNGKYKLKNGAPVFNGASDELEYKHTVYTDNVINAIKNNDSMIYIGLSIEDDGGGDGTVNTNMLTHIDDKTDSVHALIRGLTLGIDQLNAKVRSNSIPAGNAPTDYANALEYVSTANYKLVENLKTIALESIECSVLVSILSIIHPDVCDDVDESIGKNFSSSITHRKRLVVVLGRSISLLSEDLIEHHQNKEYKTTVNVLLSAHYEAIDLIHLYNVLTSVRTVAKSVR